MERKSSINPGKRQVQIFSKMTQMKFKPKSDAATNVKLQETNKIIEANNKRANQQETLMYSKTTVTNMKDAHKKLKYLFAVSHEHFIVGNQNQIDMINLGGITHGFVDTQYCWSLSLKGSIDLLTVDIKKCLMAIISDKILCFYKYNVRKPKQLPELLKQFQAKPDARFIQFPKDSIFTIFYQRQFDVYSIDDHSKIFKKGNKKYNTEFSCKLFSVPQGIQNCLKVFFSQDNQDGHKFTLWCVKINFQMTQITLDLPQKIYQIPKNIKNNIVIQNYTKQIVFLNIGAQILAAKSGYILDSANVNVQTDKVKLRYLNNQRLVHISQKKVQIYKLNVEIHRNPNKMIVTPVDSLEVVDKPQMGQFFGVINVLNGNFAIFYQNIPKANMFTKGEISYWFVISQNIPIEQKIRQLFNYGIQISEINQEILEEKCDTARKMGLSQKQIYLQIWNRSSKSSVKDYQFILATRNYKAIHTEIQRKLKKQSMSFRQLLRIQQSCLDILKIQVYGPNCTEQNIQQYLISHGFVKKLKLFKDIQLYKKQNKKNIVLENQENNKLMINIQQYYQYKEFDIKTYLIDHITNFCLYEKELVPQIRMIIRTFRFLFRVLYRELLQQIIVACKSKLLRLLQAIPQILPFNHLIDEKDQKTLYEGLWSQIRQLQWDSNLYLDNITTIDNKDVAKQVIHSLWYKRYWLTAHQLINKKKIQIQDIQKINNSEQSFYYFISKIFDKIKDQHVLEDIINFMENFYDMLPEHLKGKIFLHHQLHNYYQKHHQQAKLQKMEFHQFLNLDDSKLFKYFFVQEKFRKNSILREIKQIYQNTCQNGLQVFNQGLLQYFKSQLSQVSDLKYILNRMNNQKYEFHLANISTYQILVSSMEYKLKLGSDNDVPIDQVLIYIQNIPISKNLQIQQELKVVQKINQEAERFKKIKINMTIKQIIQNCEDVITKIIEYQFYQKQVGKVFNFQQLRQKTYAILAQIQIVKNNIYGDQNHNLSCFIYIAKLFQNIQQISLGQRLLKDQYLNKQFSIDMIFIQNLVLYMYKWKFSQNAAFAKNQTYFKKILELLPSTNQSRVFIQNQLQFAIALSTPFQMIQYPISDTMAYPRIIQLTQILKYIPSQEILKVDIQKIYINMRKMQQISLKPVDQQNSQLFDQSKLVTLHEVYEVFLLKLIQQKFLNEAIQLIKRIVQISIPNKRYNMIFVILFIQKLGHQLNDQCKFVFLKLVSYCFDSPQSILQVIQYYFKSEETLLQKSKSITQMIKPILQGKSNFMKKNLLFKEPFRNALENVQLTENTKIILEKINLRLKATKEQFSKIQYDLLFSILCNEPFLAAKYIQLNLNQFRQKYLRSYLSYLTQQSEFDQFYVIQFSKRMFQIILKSNIQNINICRLIFNMETISLDTNIMDQAPLKITDQIDKNLLKTIKAFEKKKKSLDYQINVKKVSSKNDVDHQSIQQHLKNPEELSSKQQSEYPFSDSDDEHQQVKNPIKIQTRRRKKNFQVQFDTKGQRNKLLTRKTSTNAFGINSNKVSKSDEEQDEFLSPTKKNKMKKITSTATINSFMGQQMNQIQGNKVQVKRSQTMQQVTKPKTFLQKKEMSQIQQHPGSQISTTKKKAQKKQTEIKTRVQRQEDQFSNQKQKSNYGFSQLQIDQKSQFDHANRLQSMILKSLKDNELNLDISILEKQVNNLQHPQAQLKETIIKIYENYNVSSQAKIKVIRLIINKYKNLYINSKTLAVYENTVKIQQKYALNLPINKFLAVQALFLQSKSLDQIFKLSLPKIVQISSDQTIYKLSKLISLGFCKNLYETDITYEYIKKMIVSMQKDDTKEGSQVQLNMRIEIMRSLLNKLSVRFLKEKAVSFLQDVNDTTLRDKIVENILESIKMRGDASSSNQVKKNISKHLEAS